MSVARWRAILLGGAIFLSLAIVGLVATPVSVWNHGTIDDRYSGFDRNLIFMSPAGPAKVAGTVDVNTTNLSITAVPGSHPTVHLITTPLSFSARFDVQIVSESAGSSPLRVGFWSPETRAGQFLIFDGNTNSSIRETTIVQGTVAQDLVGGTTTDDVVLGHYSVGQLYRVTLTVNRRDQTIVTRVESSELQATSMVTGRAAPEVFDAFRPTVTLSSSSDQGIARVNVSNYILTLPSQPSSVAEESERVNDGRATALVVIIWVAAAGLVGTAIVRWLFMRRELLDVWRRIRDSRRPSSVVFLLSAGCLGYLAANAAIFRLGSLQFDVLAAKIWSYVAAKEGIAELYYHPLVVTTAAASNGVPVHEAVFPYGITSAYYFLFAGWLYTLIFSSSGQSVVGSFSLEVLLKTFNVLLALGDAYLTYLISRRFILPRKAVWLAVVFALNPAIVFVSSVWGSTETLSLFLILLSIWFAESGRPIPAFLTLALGAFSRPQMLVLAFVLGLVFIRRFGARDSIAGISWTLVVVFMVLAPIALSISPSFPVDYTLRTLSYHLANGQADPNFLGLSPGYYSIWTIPLEFVNGAHGIARMWSSSTLYAFPSVTYAQLATDLSVGFVLLVGLVLLLPWISVKGPGQYLPVVAFGMLGWLMLTPGLISRYFVYAIALIILCRRSWSLLNYVLIVGMATVITFITAYGHLAHDALANGLTASLLHPDNNVISALVFNIFSDDRFITAGTIANVVLLVTVGAAALIAMRSKPEGLAGAPVSSV